MKIIITILIILTFNSNNDFALYKSIKTKANFITVDKLGNIYLVNNDQILKYDNNVNFLMSYSNKDLGKITYVDVSDPLKILVFYKDFGQIVFLDNTLSIKGDVLLLEMYELEQSTLACSSYENAFWVYEPNMYKLTRVDKNFQIRQQSGNITQLIGEEISPNYLTESNNFIYLNDPKIGILVFDKYGTYSKTIPFKGLTSFQITGNRLFYTEASLIKTYNLKTLDETTTKLPEEKALSVNVWQNKLYILNNKEVNIYSIINKK